MITEITREKMRRARLKNPNKYWLGKKRPNMTGGKNPAKRIEVKRKISITLTGRKLSKSHVKSISDSHKGHKHSKKTRERMSVAQKGKKHRSFSAITRKKKSERMKKNPLNYWEGKYGEKHPAWIKDRTKLKKSEKRTSTAYAEWKRNVFLRDDKQCKLGNLDCHGRIEAHHILGWAKFPELRYDVNNGITLCAFHHPKGRSAERTLVSIFKDLITQS